MHCSNSPLPVRCCRCTRREYTSAWWEMPLLQALRPSCSSGFGRRLLVTHTQVGLTASHVRLCPRLNQTSSNSSQQRKAATSAGSWPTCTTTTCMVLMGTLELVRWRLLSRTVLGSVSSLPGGTSPLLSHVQAGRCRLGNLRIRSHLESTE